MDLLGHFRCSNGNCSEKKFLGKPHFEPTTFCMAASPFGWQSIFYQAINCQGDSSLDRVQKHFYLELSVCLLKIFCQMPNFISND